MTLREINAAIKLGDTIILPKGTIIEVDSIWGRIHLQIESLIIPSLIFWCTITDRIIPDKSVRVGAEMYIDIQKRDYTVVQLPDGHAPYETWQRAT